MDNKKYNGIISNLIFFLNFTTLVLFETIQISEKHFLVFPRKVLISKHFPSVDSQIFEWKKDFHWMFQDTDGSSGFCSPYPDVPHTLLPRQSLRQQLLVLKDIYLAPQPQEETSAAQSLLGLGHHSPQCDQGNVEATCLKEKSCPLRSWIY